MQVIKMSNNLPFLIMSLPNSLANNFFPASFKILLLKAGQKIYI